MNDKHILFIVFFFQVWKSVLECDTQQRMRDVAQYTRDSLYAKTPLPAPQFQYEGNDPKMKLAMGTKRYQWYITAPLICEKWIIIYSETVHVLRQMVVGQIESPYDDPVLEYQVLTGKQLRCLQEEAVPVSMTRESAEEGEEQATLPPNNQDILVKYKDVLNLQVESTAEELANALTDLEQAKKEPENATLQDQMGKIESTLMEYATQRVVWLVKDEAVDSPVAAARARVQLLLKLYRACNGYYNIITDEDEKQNIVDLCLEKVANRIADDKGAWPVSREVACTDFGRDDESLKHIQEGTNEATVLDRVDAEVRDVNTECGTTYLCCMTWSAMPWCLDVMARQAHAGQSYSLYHTQPCSNVGFTQQAVLVQLVQQSHGQETLLALDRYTCSWTCSSYPAFASRCAHLMCCGNCDSCRRSCPPCVTRLSGYLAIRLNTVQIFRKEFNKIVQQKKLGSQEIVFQSTHQRGLWEYKVLTLAVRL